MGGNTLDRSPFDEGHPELAGRLRVSGPGQHDLSRSSYSGHQSEPWRVRRQVCRPDWHAWNQPAPAPSPRIDRPFDGERGQRASRRRTEGARRQVEPVADEHEQILVADDVEREGRRRIHVVDRRVHSRFVIPSTGAPWTLNERMPCSSRFRAMRNEIQASSTAKSGAENPTRRTAPTSTQARTTRRNARRRAGGATGGTGSDGTKGA